MMCKAVLKKANIPLLYAENRCYDVRSGARKAYIYAAFRVRLTTLVSDIVFLSLFFSQFSVSNLYYIIQHKQQGLHM